LYWIITEETPAAYINQENLHPLPLLSKRKKKEIRRKKEEEKEQKIGRLSQHVYIEDTIVLK
jgi:hypothetical protein